MTRIVRWGAELVRHPRAPLLTMTEAPAPRRTASPYHHGDVTVSLRDLFGVQERQQVADRPLRDCWTDCGSMQGQGFPFERNLGFRSNGDEERCVLMIAVVARALILR